MGFFSRIKEDVELYRIAVDNARTPRPDHKRVREFNYKLQKAEREAAKREGHPKRSR